MAIPTQAQILAAIVAIVKATVPTGRVWNRLRIAATVSDYAPFYIDDNGVGNVWFIRRVGVSVQMDGVPPQIISETHSYELEYARVIVDADDTLTPASETLFQKQIEDVRAAIDLDNTLGLGKGAKHTGMQILQPMPQTATLGAYAMHMAVARLDVTVTDC